MFKGETRERKPTDLLTHLDLLEPVCRWEGRIICPHSPVQPSRYITATYQKPHCSDARVSATEFILAFVGNGDLLIIFLDRQRSIIFA